MKWGKACTSQGIVLQDGQIVRGLEDGNGYRYLGVLDVTHNEMKQSTSKEYLRRMRKIVQSKCLVNHVNSLIPKT